MLCTEQNRAQLSGLDILVQQALPRAKPLAPALDAGWSCLCSDFVVTAEYTDLANAIVGAIGDAPSGDDGDAKAQRLVAAIRSIIPVFMGEQGVCSSGCREFVVQLGDWAIGSISWSTISPELAFLPPISQLEGLPATAMECVCSGVSWVEFAKLITADAFNDIKGAADGLPSLSDPASAISAAFGSGFSLASVTTAVKTALAYPAFLLGRDGFCAGECASSFKLVASYTKSVAVALIGREASLTGVGEAVQALSTDGLHTCTCGGTLDWGALTRGVTGALEALGSVSLTNVGGATQLPGQLLGVVFGPAFLCSSPTCKSMVSELMGIATSILPAVQSGDDDDGGGDSSALDAMTGVAWCPRDEAAGYTLRQTFVLDESEPFTEAKQDAFKKRLVAALNDGVTGVVKLSVGAVELVDVSPDSVSVELVMAQPALATEVQAGMANWISTPPTTLSTMLGVAVAAPPTAAERAAIAASKSEPMMCPSTWSCPLWPTPPLSLCASTRAQNSATVGVPTDWMRGS